MSFIYELVAGRHAEYNEDRLTQIFAALFNKSSGFKQIACEFLEINYDKGLEAGTQCYCKTGKDAGRLDLRIKRNNRIIIIIENKIDALLTKKQLDKYDSIKGIRTCSRAVITKWSPDIYCRKWKPYRWSEFYEFCNAKKDNLSKTDKFLIDEFLEYLEELGMKKVSKISKKELRDVADVIYNIRRKEPYISIGNRPVFETLSSYFKILDDIKDKSKQDESLKNKIGKNFQFKPWVSYYWGKEWKDGEPKDLFVCADITLKKPVNNIASIGTGIRFDVKKKGRYNVITYCQEENSEDFKHSEYYKEINIEYVDDTVTLWKKWLWEKQ